MENNLSQNEIELIKFLLCEGMKMGKTPIQLPDGSMSYMAKECVLLSDKIDVIGTSEVSELLKGI